ncbi:MAG TPA: hypothetical protein VLI90_01790 [Tepidisphaeraceae bacterium]|nr:hypothetical protein [Tepidisphaeraceae bacterium]
MGEINKPRSRTILADYFLGFATRAVSGGARPWRLYYETEGDAGLKPPRCDAAFSGDLYVTGDIKDIASTYYPAIGPYDVTDPDVAEYHVLLAKAAGIDAFMAEYTMGQEAQLLSLVQAARTYNFCIGVNWITQSHLAENTWRDRDEAMAKAHELVRWMAKHVYEPCGVRVDGRYLLMIFLAHPREPAKPFDPFFSPDEVRALKRTALEAGCDANFLVLPWEPLPESPAPAPARPGERVWDGYFPWVLRLNEPVPADQRWTHASSRAGFIERMQTYYATSRRLRDEGRIGTYIGGVCPGFDDHKGQAWGEGHRRHLPRDAGQTLADSWKAMDEAGVDTGMIITWNDWAESSQIEPSLELGSNDLIECARQIARWKQTNSDPRLLAMPLRLFTARKDVWLLECAGVHLYETRVANEVLNRVALAIAHLDPIHAAELLGQAVAHIDAIKERLHTAAVHAFWEFGFNAAGIAAVNNDPITTTTVENFTGIAFDASASTIGFAVTEEVRQTIQRGHLVGRLCVEYLDTGVDFVQVLVDAPDDAHRVIASFKKRNTGKWQRASMELVNARFTRGLDGGADITITQRPGTTGGVRMVRIDGTVYGL